jgi:hypothetical protein
MSIMLGGDRAKFVRVLGDITISGQYVNGEPALVLWPSHRRAGVTPVAVCLSVAWKYNEPSYLVRQSAKYAKLLGFSDDPANVHRIAGVINDHLLDLINMPPEHKELVHLGEARISVAGGPTKIVEMTERV